MLKRKIKLWKSKKGFSFKKGEKKVLTEVRFEWKKNEGRCHMSNGGRSVQVEGLAKANAQCQENSWLVRGLARRLRRHFQGISSGWWKEKAFGGLVGFIRTLVLYSKWDMNLDNKIQHVSKNHAGFLFEKNM